MDENPFAWSDRRESESYYRAPWIFRQIFLVVKPKTVFRVFIIMLMLRKEFSAILTLQKKAIIKERKNVGKDGGIF